MREVVAIESVFVEQSPEFGAQLLAADRACGVGRGAGSYS